MTDHSELPRDVLEHLREVFAEGLEYATALGTRARHFVRHRLPRQMFRERTAHRWGEPRILLEVGALQRREFRFARFELLEHELKLRDPLIELLARATEAHPLQLRALDF